VGGQEPITSVEAGVCGGPARPTADYVREVRHDRACVPPGIPLQAPLLSDQGALKAQGPYVRQERANGAGLGGQLLGKQLDGLSSHPVYEAARRIVAGLSQGDAKSALDLGGGAGNFAKVLAGRGWRTTLADYHPASIEGVTSVQLDLNLRFPFPDDAFDLIVSLEVIEHLENPRHFFREMYRCSRPGGHIVVSTPNQLSLASKLCLIARNEFRDFQKSSYPAHITALLGVDFERMSEEVGLTQVAVSYTNSGRIPFTTINWQVIPILKGRLFSDNVFFLFRKPEPECTEAGAIRSGE
jgi:2-polyprenyl-3-methyl-5-hydroxy-6-metoxy-1,4-benzoquinol methylase